MFSTAWRYHDAAGAEHPAGAGRKGRSEGLKREFFCKTINRFADRCVYRFETRLMASHRENPLSQCLASQPGIGPIGAVSFALRVTEPKSFRSGRHFAAWLGLTPKDNSSGGKRRQGRISRQGNEALRKLVVLGATAVIRFARPGHASPWLLNLLARKPKKLAAVALANKMARTLWAMMVSGEVYRRPLPA